MTPAWKLIASEVPRYSKDRFLMAIWKDSTPSRHTAAPSAPEAQDQNRTDLSSRAEAAPLAAVTPAARAQADRARTESLIAADIMIEGKIEGSGSVRIAGIQG